jgi:hypothetical protein
MRQKAMIHRISDKPPKRSKPRLHHGHRNDLRLMIPVGDTGSFTPSTKRPVRVRARSMPADTHFEPHSHAWAQLAYCATGVLQVTAEGDGEGRRRNHLHRAAVARGLDRARRAAPHHRAGGRRVPHALHPRQRHAPGWSGCRVLVVSPLLRESISALDTSALDGP